MCQERNCMNSPAPNPEFEASLRTFVLSMPVIQFLGMDFTSIEYGRVEISVPYRDELSFATGTFQAGPVGMLVDVAACCAIGTTLPAGYLFSTVDFTTKILAPAQGDRFIAKGAVVSTGRTLAVGEARVFAVNGAQETLCATGLATTRNFQRK